MCFQVLQGGLEIGIFLKLYAVLWKIQLFFVTNFQILSKINTF